MRILTIAPIAVLVVCVLDSDAQDVKKIVPSQKWAGKSGDEKLRKLAPEKGFLADQKSFEALWSAWSLKGDPPKLDFTKYLVIVNLAGGPNTPSASYTLDANGDLKGKVLQTLIGGPGFGYGIDVLPKAGIKTYRGKPIE